MAIVFIPALIAVLTAKQTQAGRPLTQHEVEDIRDNAVAMNMPDDVAATLSEKRGYDDIDPENVWEEWLAYNNHPEG